MKVQSFRNLTRYIDKSENFLLRNEVSNNLFWEVFKKLKKIPKNQHWAANVMDDGKIILSVICTANKYLMISSGSRDANLHLLKYLKRNRISLNGVAGPANFIYPFYQRTSNQYKNRDFIIYKSNKNIKLFNFEEDHEYCLKRVSKREWPRVRLWSLQFAMESVPQLNGSEIVASAKKMMEMGSLFIIQKKGLGTCGMGGFGRETQNFKVINLVFVPVEYRNRGFGSILVKHLLALARREYSKKCLLFSDHDEANNLYQQMGFDRVSEYCEMEINLNLINF
jgi:predicted GNAT family acetyltransferase